MKYGIVAIAVLGLVLGGCAKSSHEGVPEKPAADGGGGGGELGEVKALDFATVRAQIFTPHCIRCHGRFEEYAKVALELNRIQDAVVANRMPPRVPLSGELKSLLSEWINKGAPETAPSEGGQE